MSFLFQTFKDVTRVLWLAIDDCSGISILLDRKHVECHVYHSRLRLRGLGNTVSNLVLVVTIYVWQVDELQGSDAPRGATTISQILKTQS